MSKMYLLVKWDVCTSLACESVEGEDASPSQFVGWIQHPKAAAAVSMQKCWFKELFAHSRPQLFEIPVIYDLEKTLPKYIFKFYHKCHKVHFLNCFIFYSNAQNKDKSLYYFYKEQTARVKQTFLSI